MPTFVCDKCDTVDNTFYGLTPMKSSLFDEALRESYLCSCCAPLKFASGEDSIFTGKWHGKFEKETWSQSGFPEDVMNRVVLDRMSVTAKTESELNKALQFLKSRVNSKVTDISSVLLGLFPDPKTTNLDGQNEVQFNAVAYLKEYNDNW